jgi:Fur family zinc uptake transcriptional regulator
LITNAHLVHQPKDSKRYANAAVSHAKILCQEKGAKLTPTREAVLDILWQSRCPQGAYQVQEQLSKTLGKKIAPPTVYRALEFLLSLGLIHRISSLNAYIGCPFPKSIQSNLFMICDNCGTTAQVIHYPLNEILQKISDKTSFKLESQSIELIGLCPLCNAANDNNNNKEKATHD